MDFDINALMDDPKFQFGLGMLGNSSSKTQPLIAAYNTLQNSKRAKLEAALAMQKIENEQAQLEHTREQTKIYQQQVMQQTRKNDREAQLADQIQKFMPYIMGQLPGAQGQQAPQQPQGGPPAMPQAPQQQQVQAPAAPMPATFPWADKFVAGIEKGFVPNDGGKGPTNFGVNQIANPDVNVKNLTAESAQQLRQQRYWTAIKGDSLPAPTAAVAYDAAINQGQDYAKQLLEKTGGDPSLMIYQRRQDYAALAKSNPLYAAQLKGWNSRLDQLSDHIKTPVPAPTPAAPQGLQLHQQIGAMGGLMKIASGDPGGLGDLSNALKPDYAGGNLAVAQTNALTQQGQLDVARTRENREAGHETRLAQKEATKRAGQFAKDKAAYGMVSSAADRMIDAVDDLIKDPGLKSISGFNAITNGVAVPGSQAYGALTKLKSLTSKMVNDILQSVRQASSNGASGYGQFTEKELEVVANYVTSLDPGNPKFVESLGQVRKYAESIKDRSSSMYEESTGKPSVEGLPLGARKVGTAGGKAVYRLPDGSMVQEK